MNKRLRDQLCKQLGLETDASGAAMLRAVKQLQEAEKAVRKTLATQTAQIVSARAEADRAKDYRTYFDKMCEVLLQAARDQKIEHTAWNKPMDLLDNMKQAITAGVVVLAKRRCAECSRGEVQDGHILPLIYIKHRVRFECPPCYHRLQGTASPVLSREAIISMAPKRSLWRRLLRRKA